MIYRVSACAISNAIRIRHIHAHMRTRVYTLRTYATDNERAVKATRLVSSCRKRANYASALYARG